VCGIVVEMQDESQSPGFGNSPRRVVGEFALIGGVIVALVLGVLAFARGATDLLLPRIPMSVDATLGLANWSALAPEDRRCDNPEITGAVERLAAPLLERVQDSGLEFQIAVVEDPQVNAFALPGGYLTVYTGLLELADTGEEVAAVLAHEIQHALLRHGTSRVLHQLGGRMLLSLFLGGTDLAAPAGAFADLVQLGYGREQESEADREGQALLMDAGLDPRGLADFFERLAAQGGTPPAWMSTHPDPGDRALRAREVAEGFEARLRAEPPPRGLPCRLAEAEDGGSPAPETLP